MISVRIGYFQLNRLDECKKRQELVFNYNRLLSDAYPIIETRGKATNWNSCASFIFDFNRLQIRHYRQAVMRKLQRIGIGTQVITFPYIRNHTTKALWKP